MRGVMRFLSTLIIGVALIWLGFWWVAQARLQSGFTAWAETQATNGWKISYDSIHRGSSLLHAAVTVNNLVLTPPPPQNGLTSSFTLPAVTLRIDALNPLVFHLDLPASIGLNIAGHVDLALNTASIAVAETLDPNTLFNPAANPFRGNDVTAKNIDILASGGSLLVLHIDSLASHTAYNLAAAKGAIAFSTTTALDGLKLSAILTRLGGIPFEGQLAHIAIATRLSGPVPATLPKLQQQLSARLYAHDFPGLQRLLVPFLHDWAAQGGNADAALDLVLGPTTLHATGSVQFDANLQPNGAATLSADHLDQFTATLTDAYPALQDNIARAEAQFSPYLGNTTQGGQTLTLHIAYGKPGIFINGEKTADMAPMNWNAPENPPPPPNP
jgi:hypothetical protein